jgi:hypothetical protein
VKIYVEVLRKKERGGKNKMKLSLPPKKKMVLF